jgi:flagellar basal-body rod protein FlgG
VFLTRDGRFGRDANNDLVTSHGYYVLSETGGHIRLPDEPVSVGADGSITAGAGEPVDRIGVVDFAPAALQRAGEAYFVATVPGTPINGGIRQGFTEMSNANLGEELVTLMTVHRAFQANQTVLARLDQTLNQAAGELGTVR